MSQSAPTEYRLHDPDNLSDCEQRMIEHLAWFDRDHPFCVAGLSAFSLVVERGFRRVTYESHRLESGLLYWITDDHARMIGKALAPSLRYWGLVLTTFERRGFELIADSVADEVQIDEVLIKHDSGDEVTVREARGLARLVTKLRTRTLHLWSGEYDPGAIESLCATLRELDNRTLGEADVCDTSLPEPADQIPLPALEELLARNAGRGRPPPPAPSSTPLSKAG